ncbi:F-box domain protein [Kalmanozyma brasiliensis GHG001]|uniref:F-box domain protein n=1 Tax=Kalmanozyma brasiliensis (strain GHG001) TaxID=1365824 RepID=UPI0028683394|nr:F-box domain protein [Kalmanozyma brasiliensis GHG001]KAF6766880.1 F-box domain protein [Kalmanozyma brasiliensis GHG001]
MGRRRAAKGHHAAASNTNWIDVPIFRLPTDVWLHIFASLPFTPAPTLAALSVTCKRLLQLVDEHGWRTALQQQFSRVPLDRILEQAHVRRSRWWAACWYAAALDYAWDGVTLRPAYGDVPKMEGKRIAPGGGRRGAGDFAIPTLTLGNQWMVVGVRSELCVYHARPRTGKGRNAVARIRVDSRTEAGEGPSTSIASTSATKGNGSLADDPYQDITALEAINAEASLVAVGYATGCVQVIALKSTEGAKGKWKAEVMHHFPSTGRQDVAGISVRNGIRAAPPTHSNGSTLTHTKAEDCLLASLSKRGCPRIHTVSPQLDGDTGGGPATWSWQIDSDGEAVPLDPNGDDTTDSGTNTPRTHFRSAAFNNAPLEGSTGATRAWSVLLGSSTDTRKQKAGGDWLAVGLTAEHAVYIYPLDHRDGVQLEEPFYVASTGQRTSVYAMATPPATSSLPSFLLFVGFYDGVVRVYDTRQTHPDDGSMSMQSLHEALPVGTNGARPRRRHVPHELHPIAHFRDTYSTDAIYSLSFGGTHADRLVVGGARFAQVRVFDVSSLAGYDVPLLAPSDGAGGEGKDWTAFAVPGADSPLYCVVGEADRLVGVTDKTIWSFDFGAPLLEAAKGRKGSDEKGEAKDKRDDGTVAFFRHRDGRLCYSNLDHRTRTNIDTVIFPSSRGNVYRNFH